MEGADAHEVSHSIPQGGKPMTRMDPDFSHVYLDCYENEKDLEFSDEEEDNCPSLERSDAMMDAGDIDDAQVERYGQVSGKRPRLPQYCDEPDLAAYFAEFEGFDELSQAKYCRAYANMLAAKSDKNKIRNRHGAPYVKYAKKE